MSVPYNEVKPTNSDNFSIVNRPLWDRGYDYVYLGNNSGSEMSVDSNLGSPNVSMSDIPDGDEIISTEMY
jgi:hypothetical protein